MKYWIDLTKEIEADIASGGKIIGITDRYGNPAYGWCYENAGEEYVDWILQIDGDKRPWQFRFGFNDPTVAAHFSLVWKGE